MSHKCEHGKDSDTCVQCWEEKNLEPPLTSPEPVTATGRGEVIETPRTKAATYAFYDDVTGNMTDVVDPEDMEQLERELITAEKERDELKAKWDKYSDAYDVMMANHKEEKGDIARRCGYPWVNGQGLEPWVAADNLRNERDSLKSQLSAAEKARDDYATEIYRLAEELQKKK